MDFIDFNFVLLDASGLPARPARVEQEGHRRERLDLVARQFGEFLHRAAPAGEPPQFFPPTHDFKLRREATAGGAWLAFMVDREGGAVEEFSTEAAYMVFARSDNESGRKALARLAPLIDLKKLPPAPLAVAVRVIPKVPSVITEWFTKAAAGFFGGEG